MVAVRRATSEDDAAVVAMVTTGALLESAAVLRDKVPEIQNILFFFTWNIILLMKCFHLIIQKL